VANPEKFKEQAKIFAKALLDHPVSGQALPTYGTTVLINILNEAGGLPTKNFRYGSVEHANEISGEKLNEIITQRHGVVSHGCHAGCIMKCSQVYVDPDGKYISAGFEYETIWALGANACIDNLDDISYIDHAMDDVGIDSIECANSIAVAMDAGVLGWGDGKEALRIVNEEICKGTPLGRIIGGGAAAVGTAYGITRIPVVKGQSIPAYDPRSVKGMGITYATSPMGADHTAGYAVCQNILKVGGFVDPLLKEGQVDLSRTLQIATAAIDSCGFCIFVAFPALDIPECFQAMYEMVNAR
jgi:aldehyde:ferredoxin oxidoreductase